MASQGQNPAVAGLKPDTRNLKPETSFTNGCDFNPDDSRLQSPL